MFVVNKNPSSADVRTFGWVMIGGFGVLGTLLWFIALAPTGFLKAPESWAFNAGGRHVTAIVMWSLGLLSFMICQASFSLGARLYVVWMTGAMYLGVVMTTFMLTVLFVVLLPIFSLIKLSDPLRLKFKPNESYWEDPSPHEPTLERTLRQF